MDEEDTCDSPVLLQPLFQEDEAQEKFDNPKPLEYFSQLDVEVAKPQKSIIVPEKWRSLDRTAGTKRTQTALNPNVKEIERLKTGDIRKKLHGKGSNAGRASKNESAQQFTKGLTEEKKVCDDKRKTPSVPHTYTTKEIPVVSPATISDDTKSGIVLGTSDGFCAIPTG